MQKNFHLLIFLLLLLTSCQRETAFERVPGILSGDSSLLVKRVDESTEPGVPGKITATYEYEYDLYKKLVGSNFISIYENITRSSEGRYMRDNKGRIITVENRSQKLLNGAPYVTPEGPAFDTSIINVAYQDDSSRKINYIKGIRLAGGKTAVDSTVYEYDNNDHVKKTISYYLTWAVHQPGEMLALSGYMSWIFNEKGSLTQLEQYVKDNAGLTMQIRYRFEYDNKINPLFINEDVFLSNWFELSPNNTVKQNVYYPVTGENYDNTAVYQYRSDNKPLSVTYFSPVVTANMQSFFYYK
jgi:hypothetical protein